jgi:hypothetical protein
VTVPIKHEFKASDFSNFRAILLPKDCITFLDVAVLLDCEEVFPNPEHLNLIILVDGLLEPGVVKWDYYLVDKLLISAGILFYVIKLVFVWNPELVFLVIVKINKCISRRVNKSCLGINLLAL